jgi:hypothetical protein
MPRRDEEKRMAFLRSLAVEDLANRRITEHSSELEKRMIHDARDAMKEKNDARYMARHKKKAAVDVVKTQFNNVGRRAQTEVFGREGGLTGGMVGSWLLGGTLAAGTIAGVMSRGKFGKMRQGSNAIGRMARQRIQFLDKASMSNKDTDAFIGIMKRVKKGSISPDDRIWLRKKSVFYKNKEKNSLPFMKDHKKRSSNPNPKAKVEKPVATNTPVTQPAQNVGNPKRGNPNVSAMNESQKDVLSKLARGRRLTKEEYAVLHQLKKDGKLSKMHQSLLSARSRAAKANRKLKASQTKPVAQQPAVTPTTPPQPVATPAPPPPVVVPKIEVAGKYSDDALKSMLSKGGTLPKDFPAYPDAVQQLRKTHKTPALSLTKDGDYAEQMNEFARAISEVAKRSPLAEQESVCLLLSHKVVQANRPIENFGRTLYGKAIAILNEGAEVKKKVMP